EINLVCFTGDYQSPALIAGPDVLRFAPALNIPLADIAEAFVRLDRAVARLTR
ncbi:hypothetical protein ACQR9E_27835, partial [Klebsiella pneumoniae]